MPRRNFLTRWCLPMLAIVLLGLPLKSPAAQAPGATPYSGGTAFRVWAPHGTQVNVSGTFNNWSKTAGALTAGKDGFWSGKIVGAKVGDEYRYLIKEGGKTYSKRDPYARLVTTSTYNVGNSIIYDAAAFDWGTDSSFTRIPLSKMVIYEMHIGTFNASTAGVPGTFQDAIARLDHIKELGATTVEVIPVNESPGLFFNGYALSELFAVENLAYGGPDGFKAFVKACHARGLGVLYDVVYNHWGPYDLDLYQYDGWFTTQYPSGIYFYDKNRINSPFGPRPNYSTTQVRNFIFDNLKMWIGEYHVDGFRWDSTSNIDHLNNGAGTYLPDGWSLMQQANTFQHQSFPDRVSIAEDLVNRATITGTVASGGAGFDSQWHYFSSPVRQVLTTATDAARNLSLISDALTTLYNGQAYHRVIYSESHDQATAPGARLTVQIDPTDPNSWKARKLSTLGAGLTFTAPGVPMIWQGQEFLEQHPFDPAIPMDWTQLDRQPGIFALYQDLVALDLNKTAVTPGLRGNNISVFHQDNTAKVLAYRRWDVSAVGNDVIVAANFTSQTVTNYAIGFPRAGTWHVQFNSDDQVYSPDFTGAGSTSVQAGLPALDGMADSAHVTIAPYSMLIFSED